MLVISGTSAISEFRREKALQQLQIRLNGCHGLSADHVYLVDLERSLALIEEIPGECVAVAESGIRGADDARAAGDAGANAILVGGWLMKGDPFGGVEALVGHPRRPRAGASEPEAADTP